MLARNESRNLAGQLCPLGGYDTEPAVLVLRHQLVRGRPHRNGAAHNVQQHFDAAIVVNVLKLTNQVRKRTGAQPHTAAHMEFAVKVDAAVAIDRVHKHFDKANRKRGRSIIEHDQRRYTEGAVDAAPSVAAQIEQYEKIPWEKGRKDGPGPTRVSHRLPQTRCKCLEAL